MPHQDGVKDFVMDMIVARRGHVWTDTTDTVAGGVGVARTAVDAAYRIPDKARNLLGWRPTDVVADAAAAESAVSVFDIVGTNFNYQPQEVIAGTAGATLLLEGAVELAHSEYYDTFIPTNGGETIDVGIEPGDAVAGNRRAAAEFTYTDIVNLTMPPIYSQASREVTVDGAGNSAGTTLSINKAHVLIEAGGLVYNNGVVTVEEEIDVTLRLSSTVWKPVNQINMLLEPVPPVVDATVDQGEPAITVARRRQRVEFDTDRASVTANFDLDVDVTVAAAGIHYLRWI